MGSLTPDPVGWLTSMYALIVSINLHTILENLAWTLVVVLVSYGLIRLIYFGRGAEAGLYFGRMMLALLVLTALPTLRGVVHDTWVSAYDWANQLHGPSGVFGLATRLADAGDIIETELGTFMASRAILELGGSGVSFREAIAIGQLTGDPLFIITGIITAVLTPLLFAIYAALIFVSGLVVLIGVTLLPIAGTMLMLPGQGASWLSAWVRMYGSALFTVLFLPIIFGMILSLGMVTPVETMAQSIVDINAELMRTAAEVESARQADTNFFDNLDPRVWVESLWQRIESSVRTVGVIVISWLMSLIMAITGFIIGLFLLLKLERLLTGFVGGVIGGSAPAVGGVGLALALKGVRFSKVRGVSQTPAAEPQVIRAPYRREPPQTS